MKGLPKQEIRGETAGGKPCQQQRARMERLDRFEEDASQLRSSEIQGPHCDKGTESVEAGSRLKALLYASRMLQRLPVSTSKSNLYDEGSSEITDETADVELSQLRRLKAGGEK